MPWCVLEVAHGVGVERARRRRMSRAGSARSARPPRRPSPPLSPDQLQRHLGRLALVAAQDLERRAHAEAAVEPAAVGHGVDVRADDDDLVALARNGRPQVPGDVALDGRVGLLELAEQPFARLAPVLAPGEPVRPVGVAGQLLQLFQVLERTLPVEVRHARKIGATQGRCGVLAHACSAGRSQSSCLPCSCRASAGGLAVREGDASRAAIATSTRRCSAGG